MLSVADIDGLIFDELIDAGRVGGVDNWRYRVLLASALVCTIIGTEGGALEYRQID